MLPENDSLIYPGIYVPRHQDEIPKWKKSHLPRSRPVKHAVQITEQPDSFKLEMAIPGALREDFLVSGMGHTLVISVIPTPKSFVAHREKPGKRPALRFSSQQVHLPPNTDTEFISAEFSSGVLRIIIPKSQRATKPIDCPIAVY